MEKTEFQTMLMMKKHAMILTIIQMIHVLIVKKIFVEMGMWTIDLMVYSDEQMMLSYVMIEIQMIMIDVRQLVHLHFVVMV